MSVLQTRSQSGFSGLTAATVWTTANCTIGSVLWAFVYWDSNTATCTVADPNNGAWTAIGVPQAGASGGITGYRTQMFVFFGNVTATKPIVTATFSTTRADAGLCIVEVSSGPTIVESSNYATSAAANPSQSLTPNFSADAIICFIFCESSAASAVGGGFSIVDSTGGNPVAANTAPTGGSPATANWTSITQATVLGMAVLGNPAGPVTPDPFQIQPRPHSGFGPF